MKMIVVVFSNTAHPHVNGEPAYKERAFGAHMIVQLDTRFRGYERKVV